MLRQRGVNDTVNGAMPGARTPLQQQETAIPPTAAVVQTTFSSPLEIIMNRFRCVKGASSWFTCQMTTPAKTAAPHAAALP